MGSNLTNFEDGLRQALDGFELPYNSAEWEQLEQKMGKNSGGVSNGSLIAAAAAAIVVVGASAWYFTSDFAGSEGLTATISLKSSERTVFSAFEDKLQNSISWAEAQNIVSQELSDSNDLIALNEDSQNTSNIVDDVKNNPITTNDVVSSNDSPTDSEDKTVVTEVEEVIDDLAIVPSTNAACVGTMVTFEVANPSEEFNYLWNFGNGKFATEPIPDAVVYDVEGLYDVTLVITKLGSGELITETKASKILIKNKPDANFDFEFINNPGEPATVQMTNVSQGTAECVWFVDGIEMSSEINPSFVLNKKGEHEVKLVSLNSSGCEDAKIKYIKVDKDYNLMAPEKFNPESSDERYQVFMPRALKMQDWKFKLTIFDGKEPIFESTDSDKGWNGTMPNGAMGDYNTEYPWIVILYNDFGEEEYYSGTIAITP